MRQPAVAELYKRVQMSITGLDHVNICTPLFEETIQFYERSLGLVRQQGASSQNRLLNSWLATPQGGVVIHVNGPALGASTAASESSRLDHFAFRCNNLKIFMRRLEAAGTPFEQRRIEARSITQLVLYDPNGIKVELTFLDGETLGVS
jgi:catechol 2,3-dioxygenase-like lactoylglutathione lyase family enzyme